MDGSYIMETETAARFRPSAWGSQRLEDRRSGSETAKLCKRRASNGL